MYCKYPQLWAFCINYNTFVKIIQKLIATYQKVDNMAVTLPQNMGFQF